MAELEDPKLIPLIPLIVEQMRLGRINNAEKMILKQVFDGELWDVILEESNGMANQNNSILVVVNEYLENLSKNNSNGEGEAHREQHSVIHSRQRRTVVEEWYRKHPLDQLTSVRRLDDQNRKRKEKKQKSL